MKTIKSLCSVLTTGATNSLFEKTELDDECATYLLTGSSISLDGEILATQLGKVVVKEGKSVQRFLLQEGDVVLLAKGNSIRAAYVTADIAKLSVIAATNFILLRPDQDKLLGEVLVTYLNSPEVQTLLNNFRTGIAIKSVSLSRIKELEIEMPELKVQHKIAELFYATNHAYQSTIQLAEQQKKVATAYINQLMRGGE